MIEFLFTKTPLVFFVQNFWRDEAFTYFLSKESFLNILIFSAKDFTPPLYALLIKFWMIIFGSSEVAIRSFSFLSYILCSIFFLKIVKEFIKPNKIWSFIYSLFFFINPMLNYFAFEARTYSLLTLFTVASYYFLLKKKYLFYSLTITAGLFSHYFMIFIIFGQFIYMFFYDKKYKKIYKYLLIPILTFIPWISFVIFQNKAINDPFWINQLSREHIKLIPAILYSGYESGFYYLNNVIKDINYLVYFYFFAGLFLLQRGRIKNKNIFTLLLLWSFLPSIIILIISSYKPLFLARYLIISTPGIILFLIFINEYLPKYLKIIFFSLIFLLTFNYTVLQSENRLKDPIKKTISDIMKISKRNDLLYVTSELDYHSAKYYFGDKNVYIYDKKYEQIPNFVGKVLIPKSSIRADLPKFPVKAIILYPNLTYEVLSEF